MLKTLIAKFGRKAAPCSRLLARPSLEELECRITPVTHAFPSYTDATVQITPNFLSGTVTETVTATVTGSIPGVAPITPAGTVLFNLSNQQQNAKLNSNGQATVSFRMPIFAMLTSQTLEVHYAGAALPPPNYDVGLLPSEFIAPLYMNYDNLLLPATLSFGQLSLQQLYPGTDPTTGLQTQLRSYNTAQAETDNFGIFSFHYTDPGIIDQVEALGFTLPGLFAAQLDTYGPQFSGSS